LRIEAGTRIRFGVLGSLRVEGALEVAGTADQPVNLIPLSDDPTKDWWVGIELAPGEGEGGSRLSHCRVMGAEIGVRAAGGRAEVDHCTFERCGRVSVLAARRGHLTMADCEVVNGYRIGVECEAAAGLQITGGKITGLTTHGVMLKEAAGESFIRGSRIERCGWDGVLVRGTCSPMIEDCRILDNGGNGVCATEGASPAVVNTRVENNAKAGISLQERWEAAIRGSTVGGNRGGGIVAKVRCNGEITDNLIENNGRVGLSLSLDCAPSVTNNRFFKNQGPGLLLQNSQPKALRDNQFIGNAEAALRNEGDGVVQAAHNWWGSTSETEIAKLIQDRSDNPAWGEVEFRPWLSSEPRATPERESTGK